jgi:hypothetical protein
MFAGYNISKIHMANNVKKNNNIVLMKKIVIALLLMAGIQEQVFCRFNYYTHDIIVKHEQYPTLTEKREFYHDKAKAYKEKIANMSVNRLADKMMRNYDTYHEKQAIDIFIISGLCVMVFFIGYLIGGNVLVF